MDLETLLNFTDCKITGETKEKEIRTLAYHSAAAGRDSIFFAAAGRDTDGSLYIEEVIKKGCKAVVVEEGGISGDTAESMNENAPGEVTFIQVHDVRHTMARIASRFYGEPSEEMTVIGVTGTKGKTSVAYMIWKILEAAGIKCGIIGTVLTGFDGNLKESERTTPESADIQKIMRIMKEAGCEAVVMEVSSQGVMHRRTDFIDFDIGVFTNLSPDHIGKGEHACYEEYRYWKSRFFKQCKTALMNIDDAECVFMAEAFAEGRRLAGITRKDIGSETAQDAGEDIKGKRAGFACKDRGGSDGKNVGAGGRLMFYGKNKNADFRIEDIKLWSENGALGVRYLFKDNRTPKKPAAADTAYTADTADLEGLEVSAELPGDFNAYNSAAALAVSSLLGIPQKTALQTVSRVRIPGRGEIVPISKDFTVMVDYAHNGTSLSSLLKNLGKYEHNRLIAVFGCGGDRDRSRRKEMAEAASEFADIIIVTSDNPRTEDPLKIIKDITDNIPQGKETAVIPDRREAIRTAVGMGEKGDVIVIAGKGHENYQIIGSEKQRFDDREEILSFGKEYL